MASVNVSTSFSSLNTNEIILWSLKVTMKYY